MKHIWDTPYEPPQRMKPVKEIFRECDLSLNFQGVFLGVE